MNKTIQKLLDTANRNARAAINAKLSQAQKDKQINEDADKYGVSGKLQGVPKKVHGGKFQRPATDDDWANYGKYPSRAAPVLSVDNAFKIGDGTRV